MPNVNEHKSKAEHNENVAASQNEISSDWVVTMLFYAAVHYVEAYFANGNPPKHSSDHTKRDSAIGLAPHLKPIWSDYRELKNQSLTARYEAHVTIGPMDITNAHKRLKSIKDRILPKI